jgi:arylsulfatase A-like enzyme
MSERQVGFHLAGLSFVATILMIPVVVSAADKGMPPNFLFILADDLGYMDIAANNPDSFYDTPNINALARDGMRFTDAYAAAPVCSPTRASILTGKYPARLGITDYIEPTGANQPQNWGRKTSMFPAPYVDRLSLDEVTFAEKLEEAGYRTFFAGKWHLGPPGFWPEQQGFEINKGGTGQGAPYGGNQYFSPYENPRLPDGPPGEHLPDRLASETVRFIDENRSAPFIAFLSFYSVHTPLMARSDLEDKYRRRREAGPADAWGWERDQKVRLNQNDPTYAAMVEAMDQAIGKVLKTLSAAGLDANTIVIFLSDNGGLSTSHGFPTSNLPLRAGKGWLYEGGIRVPLIIRWPGVTRPSSVSSEPVMTTDFFPTILEMAGLGPALSPGLDGVSLVPLLKDQRTLPRESIYWHFPHYSDTGGVPGAVVRSGDWKLIEFFEDGRVELYNIKADVGERSDLAQSQPDKAAELRSDLHAWQASVNAKFPEEIGLLEYWLRYIPLFR